MFYYLVFVCLMKFNLWLRGEKNLWKVGCNIILCVAVVVVVAEAFLV